MAKTLYDKIFDDHVVDRQPDGTCLLYIDRHLVHEVTSPQAFEGLRMSGRKVRAPEKTLAVVDHNVPTTDRRKGIADEDSRVQVQTPFVDSLDLRAGEGRRVFAHGLIPSEGEADLRVQVSGFQIADATAMLQGDVEARGLVSLDAVMTGTAASPVITGTAGVTEGRYRDAELPVANAAFSYRDETLEAEATLARQQDSTVIASDVSTASDAATVARLMVGFSVPGVVPPGWAEPYAAREVPSSPTACLARVQ